VLVPVSGQQIRDVKDAHRRSIKAGLAALDIPLDDPIAVFWLEVATKGEDTLSGRAHRQNLRRLSPGSDDVRVYMANMERLFDRVLQRLETRFASYLKILDVLWR
jgi:hypothetical protein